MREGPFSGRLQFKTSTGESVATTVTAVTRADITCTPTSILFDGRETTPITPRSVRFETAITSGDASPIVSIVGPSAPEDTPIRIDEKTFHRSAGGYAGEITVSLLKPQIESVSNIKITTGRSFILIPVVVLPPSSYRLP